MYLPYGQAPSKQSIYYISPIVPNNSPFSMDKFLVLVALHHVRHHPQRLATLNPVSLDRDTHPCPWSHWAKHPPMLQKPKSPPSCHQPMGSMRKQGSCRIIGGTMWFVVLIRQPLSLLQGGTCGLCHTACALTPLFAHGSQLAMPNPSRPS